MEGMSTRLTDTAALPVIEQPIATADAERIVANLHGGDTVIAEAVAEHEDVYAGYLTALSEITRAAGLTPARRRLFGRRPAPSTTDSALRAAVAAVYDRARADYRNQRSGADRAAGLIYGAAAALAQVHTRGTARPAVLVKTLEIIHEGLRADASWSRTGARLLTVTA
jgi:hypothetical protein